MKYVHNFIPQNVEYIKLNIYTLMYKLRNSLEITRLIIQAH